MMKNFANLTIVFILIVAFGVFVGVEVLYFRWLFPEITQSEDAGIILYSILSFLLVIYLLVTQLINPLDRLEKANKSSKKELLAVEEVRNVLFKCLVLLIILGIAAPFFVLAIVWVF